MSTIVTRGTNMFLQARQWARVHHRSLDLLVPLLVVVGLVNVFTFYANFGTNDDTGTYASQAYAVLHMGELAHYTYWYDHPYLGWVLIAGYAFLTRGFERSEVDVAMASEFMFILQLVSCVLVYMLMRRLLPERRWAAGLAVGLFGLSPLALYFQKMVFLDNISVTLMLAAMVAASSYKRSLGMAFWSAIFAIAATLSKETAGFILIPVCYMLWQNHGGGKSHRLWSYVVFSTVYVSIGFVFYGLVAILKGELLPGPGHVSLIGSLLWQLNRDDAGNPLESWLLLDRWLPIAATAATVLVLLHLVWRLGRHIVLRIRGRAIEAPTGRFYRFRPIAVGFALLAVMVFRGGYVPAPFIINVLPFAALVVAGVLGVFWPSRSALPKLGFIMRTFNVTRVTTVLVVAVAALVVVAPRWSDSMQTAASRAELHYYEDTLEYIKTNVPKDAVIAVDDNMWLDLKQAGYTNVVWFYKIDLDPAVQEQYVPGGYKDLDYVALRQLYFYVSRDASADSLIVQAEKDSQLVAQFGDAADFTANGLTSLYNVRKVNKNKANPSN